MSLLRDMYMSLLRDIRTLLYSLSYSLLTLSSKIRNTIMSQNLPDWDEDAFWRKLILPQEDRKIPWEGKGYRWFRSSNIVPIEQWRRQDEEPKWRIRQAKMIRTARHPVAKNP